MTTTTPTLPNQQQQRDGVARRISITCSNDCAPPSTPTRSHDSSTSFNNSTNIPMLNGDNKIPIGDWFIMHSRTDSESATCYYSPPTHLTLHPGYVMIGGNDSTTTTANTNICHEMNTGCSMFTNSIKKMSPTFTCTNNSYDMSETADDTDMKSSEEDFILVSPSFPDLSLSSTTSLDDIDVSGHGDDMDDDSIDLDMLSISSPSPPPPSTIRLAARPRSFSPSNSTAFTPSVVSRVSPIKELSTLFSSTGLNTFTPIQVQEDDKHDDTPTKTSFRKSPYLW